MNIGYKKSPTSPARLINCQESLVAAIANEPRGRTVVISNDYQITDDIACAIDKTDGTLEASLLGEPEELLNQIQAELRPTTIGNIDTYVIAVFAPEVYALRQALLQVTSAVKRSTVVLAPTYPYDPRYEDQDFVDICHELETKTPWKQDFWQSWKSYGVFQLLLEAPDLPGDCIEFGCFRGYSSSFLAEMIQRTGQKKTVHLFDTWEGMPGSQPFADNFYQSGDFADTSLEQVKSVHKPWSDTFQYWRGDICKTVKVFPPTKLCYVRIDVDLYEPTLAALKAVFECLVPGGILYLDDYVSQKTVGERLAVDKFLRERPERVRYLLGDRAYVRKQ